MDLKPEDPVGAWISHYYNSDHPRFDGVSKAGRIKMAVADYHKAHVDKTVRQRAETKSLRKTFEVGAGPRRVAGGKLRKDKREDTRGFSYKSLKEMILHFNTPDKRKEKYKDEAAKVLKRSYEPLGGYGGFESGSDREKELIRHDYEGTNAKLDVTTARLRKKNGGYDRVPHKVNAVTLNKNQHGQKVIGLGHDGSRDGKKGVRKLLNLAKDPTRKIWGEYSGPLKKVADKMDLPKVHSKHSSKLTGKDTTPVDDHAYERNINGKKYTKAIYGYPDIKDD